MTEQIIKNVSYLGKDSEIENELKSFVEKLIPPPFQFFGLIYQKDALAKHCFENQQNIVFIDFTGMMSADIESLLNEVIYLKTKGKYRSTLFCSIFENAKQANELIYLSSQGFQLSFIKGQDELSFFMDAYRIAIDDEYAMPRFAKASNIMKPLELICCSSLRAIGDKSFIVETDICLEQDDELPLNLNIFPDLKKKKFKVLEHFSIGLKGTGLETYILQLPFAGPWDEVTDETLQEETVQTWIENNDSFLRKIKPEIFLFNPQFKDCERAAFESPLSQDITFSFLESCQDEELITEMRVKHPPIVFFEFYHYDKINHLEATAALEELIQIVTQIEDYHPIIILGSCPSSTVAMRKTFQYEKMLATSDRLDWSFISELAKKFTDKHANAQLHQDHTEINQLSDKTFLEVLLEVNVTSLTEHEICFTTPLEIPFYSVFKMDLPISALVTVIPPPFELEKSNESKHYLGIIHGTSETELNRMRKFINQIIYRPIESFEREEVERLIAQKEPQEKEKEVQKVESNTDNDQESEPETNVYKKSRINGKSKL